MTRHPGRSDALTVPATSDGYPCAGTGEHGVCRRLQSCGSLRLVQSAGRACDRDPKAGAKRSANCSGSASLALARSVLLLWVSVFASSTMARCHQTRRSTSILHCSTTWPRCHPACCTWPHCACAGYCTTTAAPLHDSAPQLVVLRLLAATIVAPT